MKISKFKILCIDQNTQTSKIINAVFNSVPHVLDVTESPHQIISDPDRDQYDLIVINRTLCNCTVEDIKKIRISFPDLAFIIIDQKPENIEHWIELDNLKFLTIAEIESKLPIFLGDFYSKDQNKFEGSFNFMELLKNSLYNVKNIILISDIKSNIIFLNREAENLFQLQRPEYDEMQLTDYMVDGAKVWSYIIDRSIHGQEENQRFAITFTDNLSNEYEKQMIVHNFLISEDFIMLQSGNSHALGMKNETGNEYAVLNKFADSIANELMNPINNISGRIQLLQSDLGMNEKYKKSLDSLENQVNRINETMSKLFTFARLKQDTIPQKIDLNDLFNKLLMDPSITRLLEQNEVDFKYNLDQNLPPLSGLISHFSLLIKISLEICFECLGNKGRILVETNQLNDYLKQDWVAINIILDYTDSIMIKKGCLQDRFKHSNFDSKSISIESTIVDHVIHHYQGLCQINTEIQDKEIVEFLFPLPKYQNASEDR